MAKRKKRITQEQRIIAMLKEKGFTEINLDDRKKPWYKSYAESIDRWRREELGKPLTVRERKALYNTNQTKTAKAKA